MSKKGAKAAQSTKETVSYDVRDIVLAKVRGFPPWPGMVSCFSQKRVNYWPCLLSQTRHATLLPRSLTLIASPKALARSVPTARGKKVNGIVSGSSLLVTSTWILSFSTSNLSLLTYWMLHSYQCLVSWKRYLSVAATRDPGLRPGARQT